LRTGQQPAVRLSHLEREELLSLGDLLLLGAEGIERVHISKTQGLSGAGQAAAYLRGVDEVLHLLGGLIARYLADIGLVGLHGVGQITKLLPGG
jgi:hypothetical protein